MLKIDKDLWTSKSRHQFLYPFAVGTVDQLLKTILSFRYSCIGMLGLSDKVVIIDEVHAYDAYMLKEISVLIKWCRFYNIPVILLSATLPTKTKEKLFKAAGVREDELDIDDAYPLISIIKDKKLNQIHTPITSRDLNVCVEKTDDLEEYMLNEAVNHKAGCLVLTMPTVESAFSLFDRVKENVLDCKVIIYQGRDSLKQKTEKTEYVIDVLGKDRRHRPYKIIVVTTPIMQQSLDVDADKMVTALAPIDLLLQRMGRVWRHSDEGTIREKMEIKDPFKIVIPEKYGSLSLIYDRNLLLNTEQIISELNKINVVEDIRYLIDSVYKEDNEEERNKAIISGYNCLDTPFKDECTIIDSDEAYRKFTPLMRHTRDESYPTVQIAILKEAPPEDIPYSDTEKIRNESVVPVAEYIIKDRNNNYIFKPHISIEGLEDILIFVNEDLMVESDRKILAFTEDGLRIYDKKL